MISPVSAFSTISSALPLKAAINCVAYAITDNNDLNAFAETKSKFPRIPMLQCAGLPETRQSLVLSDADLPAFVEFVAPYETDGHKLE